MFTSIFAGALISAIAGTAMAADLPRRSVAPAPYFAKTFSWTGFYAGLNGGYNFGKFTKSASSAIGDLDGYTIGGTAGYNHQIQQFVVGVESDLDWAKVDGSTGANKGKLNSLGTIRVRAGYAADRALVYVTGGYAGGSVKVTTASANGSKWENGYAAGAGLEYSFTDNISAKAEYLYSALGSKNFNASAVTTAGANVQQVRTGVNYKF